MFIPLSPCVLLVVLSPIILRTASGNGPSPAGYLLLSPCQRYCVKQCRAPLGNCSQPPGDPPKHLPLAARNHPLDTHGFASASSLKYPPRQPLGRVRRQSGPVLSSRIR